MIVSIIPRHEAARTIRHHILFVIHFVEDGRLHRMHSPCLSLKK